MGLAPDTPPTIEVRRGQQQTVLPGIPPKAVSPRKQKPRVAETGLPTDKDRLIELGKDLTNSIEVGERDVSRWKWRRAEVIVALQNLGVSQREIADAWRISQSQVRDHSKTWSEWGAHSSQMSWSAAYDQATGFDRDAARERQTAAAAKNLFMTGPVEEARAVLQAIPPGRRDEILGKRAVENRRVSARKPAWTSTRRVPFDVDKDVMLVWEPADKRKWDTAIKIIRDALGVDGRDEAVVERVVYDRAAKLGGELEVADRL